MRVGSYDRGGEVDQNIKIIQIKRHNVNSDICIKLSFSQHSRRAAGVFLFRTATTPRFLIDND